MKHLKLGTRGSQLALWQAQAVADRIESCYQDLQVELIVIKTTGDKILDVALSRIGDKGLFTKDLEKALLAGEIDLAVHSLKDLPSDLGEGLKLASVLPREYPGDVLISRGGWALKDLPSGSAVGTSSLRRAAQIKRIRPDLTIVDIRGNVETRIKKVQGNDLDAIVLAYAGVKRLGLDQWISERIPLEMILPAVGQGVIAIETREKDTEISKLLELVNDRKTFDEIQAERAFLKVLEGGCQVPIAGLAQVDGDRLDLQGLVASLDGKTIIKDSISGLRTNATESGVQLAEQILEAGGGDILNSIRAMGD